MISIKKRGKNYQYCFEAGKVNGKRKQITKCGFKTKKEALIAGQKAYNEFINGGYKRRSQNVLFGLFRLLDGRIFWNNIQIYHYKEI